MTDLAVTAAVNQARAAALARLAKPSVEES